MNYLEQFKYVICTTIGGMLSLFFPIRDFLYAMLTVFTLNYIFGVLAGFCHGEDWKFKKSAVFFCHCAVFFVITASTFLTGKFLHADAETLGVVKALCCIAIWFYSTNIVRNWRLMLIENTTMWKVAGFVYYVLTLKVVEKIPFLNEYLKSTNSKGDSDKADIL